MNLYIRKIIAREFLVLTLGIIVLAITLIIAENYNQSLWEKWNQIKTTTIQKKRLLDSINEALTPQLPPLPSGFTLIKQSDPYGLLTAIAATEKKEKELTLKANRLKKEINKLNLQLVQIESNTLYKNNRFAWHWYVFEIGLLLFALLFGLRYFFYALRWSIKTLRIK